VVAVDERRGQRKEADAERHDAEHIESLRLRIARLGHEGARCHDERETQRHVDQEGPPPAEESGDHAAGNRTERDRDADRGTPERVGPRALRAAEGGGDDRERRREQHASADALDRARDLELQHRRGETAGCRRHEEDHETDEHHAPATVQISERSGRQQQRRERDEICADHPLHTREPGMQVARDRRQRDGDDVRIQHDERRGRSGAEQHEELLPVAHRGASARRAKRSFCAIPSSRPRSRAASSAPTTASK
jgi:hypothetical protein